MQYSSQLLVVIPTSFRFLPNIMTQQFLLYVIDLCSSSHEYDRDAHLLLHYVPYVSIKFKQQCMEKDEMPIQQNFP